MQGATQIKQLPPYNPRFDPFDGVLRPVILSKTEFLEGTQCAKWKLWTGRAIPILHTISDIAFFCLMLVLVRVNATFLNPCRFHWMPELIGCLNIFIAMHMLAKTIQVVCEAILRNDYDAYLCMQIAMSKKTECPATAMLPARLLEASELRYQELELIYPIWDTFMKTCINQYQNTNLYRATQYAHLLSMEEESERCLKILATSLNGHFE